MFENLKGSHVRKFLEFRKLMLEFKLKRSTGRYLDLSGLSLVSASLIHKATGQNLSLH